MATYNPPSIPLKRKEYSVFETKFKALAGHWPEGGKDIFKGKMRDFSHLTGGANEDSKYAPPNALMARLVGADVQDRIVAEVERRMEAEEHRFQWKLLHTEQSLVKSTLDKELTRIHTWLLSCPDVSVMALLKVNVAAYDELVEAQDPFKLLSALKDASEGTVRGAIKAAVARRYNLCDVTKFKVVTDFLTELQRIQVAAAAAGHPGPTVIDDSLLADKLMNNLNPVTFAPAISKWHDTGDSWDFATALTEVLKWVNVTVDNGSLKLDNTKPDADVKARAALSSEDKKKPGVRFESTPQGPSRPCRLGADCWFELTAHRYCASKKRVCEMCDTLHMPGRKHCPGVAELAKLKQEMSAMKANKDKQKKQDSAIAKYAAAQEADSDDDESFLGTYSDSVVARSIRSTEESDNDAMPGLEYDSSDESSLDEAFDVQGHHEKHTPVFPWQCVFAQRSDREPRPAPEPTDTESEITVNDSMVVRFTKSTGGLDDFPELVSNGSDDGTPPHPEITADTVSPMDQVLIDSELVAALQQTVWAHANYVTARAIYESLYDVNSTDFDDEETASTADLDACFETQLIARLLLEEEVKICEDIIADDRITLALSRSATSKIESFEMGARAYPASGYKQRTIQSLDQKLNPGGATIPALTGGSIPRPTDWHQESDDEKPVDWTKEPAMSHGITMEEIVTLSDGQRYVASRSRSGVVFRRVAATNNPSTHKAAEQLSEDSADSVLSHLSTNSGTEGCYCDKCGRARAKKNALKKRRRAYKYSPQQPQPPHDKDSSPDNDPPGADVVVGRYINDESAQEPKRDVSLDEVEFVMDDGCVGSASIAHNEVLFVTSTHSPGTVEVASGAISRTSRVTQLPFVGRTIQADVSVNLINVNLVMKEQDCYTVTTASEKILRSRRSDEILLSAPFVDGKGYIVTYRDLIRSDQIASGIRKRIVAVKALATHAVARTAEIRRRARQAWTMHGTIGAHCNDAEFGKMLDDNNFHQMDLTSRDLTTGRELFGPCLLCAMGKHLHPKGPRHLPDNLATGEMISSDLLPLTSPTLGGSTQMLVTVEVLWLYGIICGLSSKTTKQLELGYGDTISQLNAFGHKVKVAVSDSESNFRSCKTFLGANGIEYCDSDPYAHSSVVERYRRRMNDLRRTIKSGLDFAVPSILEGELWCYIVDMLNGVPNIRSTPMSPIQRVEGRRPFPFGHGWGQVGLWHHFGAEQRAEILMIVGVERGTYPKYRCWTPLRSRVLVRGLVFTTLASAPAEWNLQRQTPGTIQLSTIDIALQQRLRAGLPPMTGNNNLQTDTPIPVSTRGEAPITGGMNEQVTHDWGDTQATPPAQADQNQDDDHSDQPHAGDQGRSATGNETHIDAENQGRYDGADQGREDTGDLGRAHTGDQGRADTGDQGRADTGDQGRIDPVDQGRLVSGLDNKVSPLVADSENAGTESTKLAPQMNDIPDGRRSGRSRTSVDYKSLNAKGRAIIAHLEKKDADNKLPDEKSWEAIRAYHTTIRKALRGDRADESRAAISDEIKNIYVTHKALAPVTYEHIPAAHRTRIARMFIFVKDKHDTSGNYTKTKARWVYGKIPESAELGEDKSSSPTVNPIAVMCVLNMVAVQNLEMFCADVPGAFLVPDMGEDELYGYIDGDLLQSFLTSHPETARYVSRERLVFKLQRYVYGTTMASLKFYEHLRDYFMSIGFEVCKTDRCTFVKLEDHGRITCQLHVDDILCSCSTIDQSNRMKQLLTDKFQVTMNAGDKMDYVGITIERDRALRKIKLSMAGIIMKAIDKFGGPDLRTFRTPASTDIFDKTDSPPCDKLKYASLLMTLLFPARFCRTDVVFTVSVLTTRLNAPTIADYEAAMRVLGYLKGTIEYGIIYCPPEHDSNPPDTSSWIDQVPDMEARCFVDASHAVHHNGRGQAMTSISFGSGPVCVRCWVIKHVTLSSTESELSATSECVTYVIWLREFMTEMNEEMNDRPTIIYQDNSASITMNQNGGGRFKRSKHMLVRGMFITENIDDKTVALVKCDTKYMNADWGTKPLMGAEFINARHRNFIRNN